MAPLTTFTTKAYVPEGTFPAAGVQIPEHGRVDDVVPATYRLAGLPSEATLSARTGSPDCGTSTGPKYLPRLNAPVVPSTFTTYPFQSVGKSAYEAEKPLAGSNDKSACMAPATWTSYVLPVGIT